MILNINLYVTEKYFTTSIGFIAGPMIDSRIVSCGTQSEQNQLMDSLRQQIKVSSLQPTTPQSLQVSNSKLFFTHIPKCVLDLASSDEGLFFLSTEMFA